MEFQMKQDEARKLERQIEEEKQKIEKLEAELEARPEKPRR